MFLDLVKFHIDFNEIYLVGISKSLGDPSERFGSLLVGWLELSYASEVVASLVEFLESLVAVATPEIGLGKNRSVVDIGSSLDDL